MAVFGENHLKNAKRLALARAAGTCARGCGSAGIRCSHRTLGKVSPVVQGVAKAEEAVITAKGARDLRHH